MPMDKYGPRNPDFLERHDALFFKISAIALLGVVALLVILVF
jgi:hypothetical protein